MFSKSVGIELRSLNNLIHRYMDQHSHKKDVHRVTGTNGWIIGYLNDNKGSDIFQRDLEQEFGITRSTASKVINLMVQKGLVERQSVPHDARLKKLMLTPNAQILSDFMREDSEKLEQRLCTGFTEEELNILFSYLDRLKQNIG